MAVSLHLSLRYSPLQQRLWTAPAAILPMLNKEWLLHLPRNSSWAPSVCHTSTEWWDDMSQGHNYGLTIKMFFFEVTWYLKLLPELSWHTCPCVLWQVGHRTPPKPWGPKCRCSDTPGRAQAGTRLQLLSRVARWDASRGSPQQAERRAPLLSVRVQSVTQEAQEQGSVRFPSWLHSVGC